jgi:hypothetical protein
VRIVVDERGPRVVALVRHMHASGRPMRDIVAELRSMGVVNGGGHPLRLEHIWAILRTRHGTP